MWHRAGVLDAAAPARRLPSRTAHRAGATVAARTGRRPVQPEAEPYAGGTGDVACCSATASPARRARCGPGRAPGRGRLPGRAAPAARSRHQLAGAEPDRVGGLVRRGRARAFARPDRHERDRCSSRVCRWAARWRCGWPSSTPTGRRAGAWSTRDQLTDPRMRVLRFAARDPSLGGDRQRHRQAGQDEGGYDRIPLHALYSQSRLWRMIRRTSPRSTSPCWSTGPRQDHVVDPLVGDADPGRVASPDRRSSSWNAATM